MHRCAHEYDNFQQASIIDQTTSVMGYRSRFLPRVSPRALTLTHLGTLALGVLRGVSGLGLLLVSIVPRLKNVRVSSDRLTRTK